MNVAELQTLLNLYPEDLEIVIRHSDHEFRNPVIKTISVITCTEKHDKYYFENVGDLSDGETIEEVLMIN